MPNPLGAQVRPVRLLGAGGTIAMQGERAVPALDAHGLIEAIPALASVRGLEAESVLSVPSAYLTLPDTLELGKRNPASGA